MISVVMSIYNEKLSWIKEAIDSILEQSYSDVELVIIVDNPEIDISVLSYLNSVTVGNKKIIIEENVKNMGLASSMNKAISIANGEYIARMDADDISNRYRLEKELEFLNENNYDLVFSMMTYMTEEGTELAEKNNLKRDIKKSLYKGSNVVNHPTVLVKKKVIQSLGGYRDMPNSEDYDLWLRLLERGYQIGCIEEPLLQYRLRYNSASIERSLEQFYIKEFILDLFTFRQQNNGLDNYSQELLKNYLAKKRITDRKKKNFSKSKTYLEIALQSIHNGSYIKAAINLSLSFIFFPVLPYKAVIRHIK